MSEIKVIVDTLKAILRAQKITYAQLADHLGLSEASVKRMFSRGAFTLERLGSICAMAGVSIADLTRQARQRAEPLTRLTPEQEEELLSDPRLLLVAYLILNNWRYEQIVDAFQISETETIGRLARLDRLKMIELNPGNRVRRLVSRNFAWRPDGPVQAYIKDQLADFMDSPFTGPEEHLRFVGAVLSCESIERMRGAIERVMREFDEQARADADLPLEDKQGVGAVFGIRPWELPAFRNLRR